MKKLILVFALVLVCMNVACTYQEDNSIFDDIQLNADPNSVGEEGENDDDDEAVIPPVIP